MNLLKMIFKMNIIPSWLIRYSLTRLTKGIVKLPCLLIFTRMKKMDVDFFKYINQDG